VLLVPIVIGAVQTRPGPRRPLDLIRLAKITTRRDAKSFAQIRLRAALSEANLSDGRVFERGV
jgi:hypothetical protein